MALRDINQGQETIRSLEPEVNPSLADHSTPERMTGDHSQTVETPKEPTSPEAGFEAEQSKGSIVPQVEDGFLDETIGNLKKKLKKTKAKPNKIPQIRDQVTVQVERIMEDGLVDAFKAMNKIEQQEFKIKGEQTAMKIRQALGKTRVKIKEVFLLLMEWLKMLPGVNKFYLEQEAKIKAEKILALKHFDKNK